MNGIAAAGRGLFERTTIGSVGSDLSRYAYARAIFFPSTVKVPDTAVSAACALPLIPDGKVDAASTSIPRTTLRVAELTAEASPDGVGLLISFSPPHCSSSLRAVACVKRH